MITHPGAWYVRTRAVRRRVSAAIERDRAGRLALAVTDSVADGLYVVDGGGSIIYVNRAGLRMLGYEAEELIGRDARTALRDGPDGSPPAPEEAAPAVRRDAKPASKAEGRLWCKDGSMLQVAYSCSPVPLGHGAGSVIVFHDISTSRAATATIDLGHALGLTAVAEGVETREQEHYLCAWVPWDRDDGRSATPRSMRSRTCCTCSRTG
jgi:PAS domain S-box-containing protein